MQDVVLDSSYKKTVFYGWMIVAASTLGLSLGPMTVSAYTIGLFIRPLSTEFHWHAAQIAVANLIFMHVSVVVAPLAGWIVDRGNSRLLMPVSALCFGLAMATLFFLHNSLPAFYGAYAAAALLGALASPVPFARLISKWFDERRGLALGIVMSGVGIGGVLLPPLVEFIIAAFGWRAAYLALGLLAALLSAPVLGLLLRNTPASMGLAMDGRSTPSRTIRVGVRDDGGPSLSQALRGGVFWALLVAFALLGFAFASLVVPMAGMLMHSGMSRATAALALSALGLANVMGRVIVGALMDRVYAVWLGLIIWIPAAGAILLFAQPSPPAVLIGATVMVGLALGSEIDILSYLTGRHFGLRAFGRIYGILFSVYTVVGAWGALLVTHLIDTTKTYGLALSLMSASAVAGCAVLLLIPRYTAKAAASAHYPQARPDLPTLMP